MKKILLTILIVVLVFSVTACNVGAGKADKKVITIGVMPDVDSIPLILAENKGYFKKAGVTVKLEHFKSAKDRDSAYQSGKLDGVVSDFLGALFLKEGGFDVKITSKTDGNYKLLAAKKSSINTTKDIKGKSIAISKNTLIEYVSDRMLQSVKYGDGDVHKVIVPQIPIRLEMLQNSKVDSATLPEPLATTAMINGARLIDSTDKTKIEPGVMIFKTETIKNSSEELISFYKAYNEAIDYIKTAKVSEYIDVLIAVSGFPETVKTKLELPNYTKAKMPEEKEFNDVLNWMKNKKLIKESYSFKDITEDRFVK